jgi:hypothetical protein
VELVVAAAVQDSIATRIVARHIAGSFNNGKEVI